MLTGDEEAKLRSLLANRDQGPARWYKEVTLTANAASTVVTDARLSYFSAIDFDPMTANAAAELGAGTLYVTQANRINGQFTLTHANNAQADRTFRMTILG